MKGPDPKEPIPRRRSPAYPHISLPEAILTVTKLLPAADKNHSLTLEKAAEALGLKPESSWLILRLAALKKFGLLEDIPPSETRDRWLQLTNLAKMLSSLAPGDPIHKALRKQAALRPGIYEDLWERFGPMLPANESMREYLVQERQFNPHSVDALLENFRSTVQYAGLMESALAFDELAAAIGADSRPRRTLNVERRRTPALGAGAEVPILGQTVLGLSSEQLRAMGEKMEAATGQRNVAIPLDGHEDAVLQIPREMTAQRWQTIIDTLELWKKQAERVEG